MGDNRRALVTGAAGFMGTVVLERLDSLGFDVSGVDMIGCDDPRVAVADISTPGGWQEWVHGCELVVHTAAVVSNSASWDQAWAVNVLGTRHVVEACGRAGVGRLLHVSSAAVYSHDRPRLVTEDLPVRPSKRVYGDTKIAAEQVVWQAHAAGEIAATIVRPSDVYGPRSRPWTVLPVQMLASGQVILPARGRGVLNPLYVSDLVDGILAAAQSTAAAGQVFNLSGPAAVETREFFGHYCRMLGTDAPRVAPTGLAMVAATVLGSVLRSLGRQSEASAASMAMLATDARVSNDKARDVLGWEPQVGLEEGMALTEAWLRAEGLLPVPPEDRSGAVGPRT